MADDIVLRLRAYDCDGWEGADEIERLRDEVKRLCAAGDALAEARSRHIVVTPDSLLDAWQEARRG